MKAAAEWQSAVMPAVVVPDAAGAELRAGLRSKFAFARYALFDRGSYEFVPSPEVGELSTIVSGITSAVTGRTLTLSTSRLLRFAPGDYSLVRHDRVHEDRPVEVILDLSEAATPGAEVHYRHRGQVFFVVPSMPGALSIVERGPTVMCNHTYISKLHPNASVVRWVALFSESK